MVKFLTFWVSLLDVSTFPALPASYKKVYENLINHLLENYSNLYVYDIVLETEPVKNSTQTESRGSSSNTTRLKIYYTNHDDVPRIIRLDLPHLEHPYVHVNIENDRSDENNHVRISQDEKNPGEYDHIFDILLDTLKLYNFFSITTKHSPVSDDRMMFKEMKYWIAMYTYAIAAYSYYTTGKSKEIDYCCGKYRQKLIELLKEDGVDENESQKLSPADLFELAHSIIEKNDYIHF